MSTRTDSEGNITPSPGETPADRQERALWRGRYFRGCTMTLRTHLGRWVVRADAEGKPIAVEAAADA